MATSATIESNRSRASQWSSGGSISDLNLREEVCANEQQRDRQQGQHGQIGWHAKVRDAGHRAAQAVDAIRQRIDARDDVERAGKPGEREERAGQKEDG